MTHKHLQITRHEITTVLHLGNTINDRGDIHEFTDELVQFIEDEKPRFLQINFEQTKFFSSEAISALIRAQRRMNEYDGNMALCGMSKDMRKVFKICNLDGTVFQIYNSCRDATDAMG